MNNEKIQRVMQFYSSFNYEAVTTLDNIYSADVIFTDPLNRVEGLTELRRYFSGMLEGLSECHFEFHQVIENAAAPAQGRVEQAVLFWTMHYRHKKLAGGKKLSMTGNSHLKFQEKVFYHRDYFDAGAMLYEHVPLLGFAIRSIKKRLETV